MEDGYLALPVYSRPDDGERLIDTLRNMWVDVPRPNHDAGFNPSEVSLHVNGWGSFIVSCIAHEGDHPIIEEILKATKSDWMWPDESCPVRVQHHRMLLE